MRPFTHLVTQSLGYCCPWFFFQLYKNNIRIEERLGMHHETVRRNRREARECAACAGCQRDSLATAQAAIHLLHETSERSN